jgi:hypothetical protein
LGTHRNNSSDSSGDQCRSDLEARDGAIPFISTDVGLYHTAMDTTCSPTIAAEVGGALKRHLSLRAQVRLRLVTDGSYEQVVNPPPGGSPLRLVCGRARNDSPSDLGFDLRTGV